MKNTSCFLFLLFFAGKILCAQSTFQKIVGSALSYDFGQSIDTTSSGGFILAGYYNGFIYLVKTDENGDTLWTKGLSGNFSYLGMNAHETSDKGYIISGTTNFTANTGDMYLVKTDSMGNVHWAKQYGGPGEDEAYSAIQTFDGGYIMCGLTQSYGAGAADVYVVKTDSIGDTLWTKTFGGTVNDEARSVIQTNDSCYVIAGMTGNFGAYAGDFYLIKIDTAGNIIWSKLYGTASSDDRAYCVRQTYDGGYIMSGYMSPFPIPEDVLVIKTDANGAVLWSKGYGGSNVDFGKIIAQTSDSGFIVCGFTESFGAGPADAYLLRINSSGGLIWSKAYGGIDSEGAEYVCQGRDGGFAACGTSSGSFSLYSDIYFIKVDGTGYSGCYTNNAATFVWAPAVTALTSPSPVSTGANVISMPFTTYSGIELTTLCTTVDIEETTGENNFSLFPNPGSSQINLSFSVTGDYFLTIKNTVGETILFKTMTGKEFSVAVNDFPSGIYFVTVTDRKKNTVTKKFIKM